MIMSKQHTVNELGYILLGALTSSTVGALLLQAIGALILGLLGALGGYLFSKVVKPRLDKLFEKKNNKEA